MPKGIVPPFGKHAFVFLQILVCVSSCFLHRNNGACFLPKGVFLVFLAPSSDSLCAGACFLLCCCVSYAAKSVSWRWSTSAVFFAGGVFLVPAQFPGTCFLPSVIVYNYPVIHACSAFESDSRHGLNLFE